MRSPWAWRNWLSVGTTSSRFAAPPILPPPVWYTVSRAFMFEDKLCDVSLGLEPSLRAGSLYAYGIIKVGRNASAFLENAADRRRMRTAWGSVQGIIISKAFLLRRTSPYVGSARSWTRMRPVALFLGVFVQRSLFPSHPSHHALARSPPVPKTIKSREES